MPSLEPLDPVYLHRIVLAALEEDGARNDVTTCALVAPDQRGRGAVLCNATGVIAGLPLAQATFAALDPQVRFEALVVDGAAVAAGDIVARVEGPLAPVLSGERVALNFLQRLSGIATLTQRFVDAVAGLPVRILDTRKTTPGLRPLERYAVRAGGGENHRYNLSDAVLIKDNHIAASRTRGLTIEQIVSTAGAAAPAGMTVEIEASTVDEAREAIDAGADIVLLDNMAIDDMRRAVALRVGNVRFEASGGVTLDTVRAIAETGVDRISVGALTHSAVALDLSLELEP
ncbi:MAG: carboxylating nicotinate-nucleotide diphosphorylase [Dehalococcoidia bacterium]